MSDETADSRDNTNYVKLYNDEVDLRVRRAQRMRRAAAEIDAHCACKHGYGVTAGCPKSCVCYKGGSLPCEWWGHAIAAGLRR